MNATTLLMTLRVSALTFWQQLLQALPPCVIPLSFSFPSLAGKFNFPVSTMRSTACLFHAALVLSLTACAQPDRKPMAVFSPAAEAELEQVRTAFHNGDYSAVIRQVGRSNTLPAAAPSQYSEALKLQAFSFCLREHAFLCQDRFRQARAADPGFALSEAERDHPSWGPVYKQTTQDQP